ncbi:Signal peptidase [Pyrrhoderma noxium]|uniref:Signal peptidase n=1 Tax=Pyrrhoderma noxium TaxID=2282107 RepID=A0A286UT48_9AGAM|nr:Signal peptidase [Pyrrhoderma noxium]
MWTAVKRYGLSPAFKFLKFYCTFQVFTEYIGGPRQVGGPSMLPTFSASTEWIVEDAISVKLLNRPISRGDLIILSSPREPKQEICKRVLGLPGDTICVDPTGESSPDIPTTEHCIVPPGHIWIIGDNASNSRDSRLYGPVPIGLVKSRVVLRFYPWNKFTIFRNPTTVLGEI